MIQLTEWVFWIPDSLRDDFHHSFHNITHVTSYCGVWQRHNLPCWPRLTAYAAEYKTNRSVCHSNSSKNSLQRNKTNPNTIRFQFFWQQVLVQVPHKSSASVKIPTSKFPPVRAFRRGAIAPPSAVARQSAVSKSNSRKSNRIVAPDESAVSSRSCAQSAVFYERHSRGRWHAQREPPRDQNRRRKPENNPVSPLQSPEFPNRCRCLKMTAVFQFFHIAPVPAGKTLSSDAGRCQS